MGKKESGAKLLLIDWNFDAVPNDELVACCVWEYARESAFMFDLKQRLRRWDGSGHCPPEIAAGLNQIQQAPVPTFLHLDAILKSEEFPCPWRKLSRQRRRSLVKLDLGNHVWTIEELLESAI